MKTGFEIGDESGDAQGGGAPHFSIWPAGATNSCVDPKICKIDRFNWEADRYGTIIWTDAQGREALIGRNLIADYWGEALDGAPLPAGLMLDVPGHGPCAGQWRVAGNLSFDADGILLGYCGHAAAARGEDSYAEGVDAPDSIRELVHELRTPLNAIAGFAELIDIVGHHDTQSDDVRRARHISSQADRIAKAIDEFDAVARIVAQERQSPAPMSGASIDVKLPALCRSIPMREGVSLRLRPPRNLPDLALSGPTFENLVLRMIALVTGYAAPGEGLMAWAAVGEGRGMVEIAIDLPAVLRSGGLVFSGLPGGEPPGDWPMAPALGFHFAHRMLEHFASMIGGCLVTGENRLLLYLPADRA